MAGDTLKRIGESVCTDYLGFAPTSNGTKPPHIANGLFRAVLEKFVRQPMFTNGSYAKEKRTLCLQMKLSPLIIRSLKGGRWRSLQISKICGSFYMKFSTRIIRHIPRMTFL